MAVVYGRLRYDYDDLPHGDIIDGRDGVTNGADTIIGTKLGDTIYGLGGNDVLKGGGGADRLFGGEGIDTADYGDSDTGVQVSLAAGRGSLGTAEGDRLYDIENLSGSGYDDILEGDGSYNSLYGEGGNDVLKGGGGADKLYGGAGDDVLNSDGINDFLDGGDGVDTAVFSSSVHVNLDWGRLNHGFQYQPIAPGTPDNIVNVENVTGSNQNDQIIGNGVDNILEGRGGSDWLFGKGGSDTINGGSGADRIDGGSGNDVLIGGTDGDTFIFTKDAGAVSFGQDVITDFTVGQDHIEFDDAIFANIADVQAHMQQVGNNVVISFDGGNSITLQNMQVGALSASDFVFV